MADKKSSDNHSVSSALRDFESQAVNYAYRFVSDAKVRSAYIEKAKEFSKTTRGMYESGKITAGQAEEIAHAMRGQVMDMARARSSELGKSAAVALKEKNIPLGQLLEKYAKEKFGKAPTELTAAERDSVALEIVAAAGRTDAAVNSVMRGLGRVGRGLWVFTALIAAYNIGTARNKAVAAGREGANLAGGVVGGALTSAAVGAAITGPAAPIGAAIGLVVGGILGAILADEAYIKSAVPLTEDMAKIVPRFTHIFWRDEAGLANALYDECGINLDQVENVLEYLNEYYNSDADDVAVLYVQLVRSHGGSVEHALWQHPTIKQLLISTLKSGWTSSDEQDAIRYLQGQSP